MTPKSRRLVAVLSLLIARGMRQRWIPSALPLLLSAPLMAAPPSKVSITINPTSASLLAGGTQTFTATVSGATNTSVIWSCSAGTVTSAGLYTAPSAYGTYSVTATSQADTTKAATAAVTVSAVAVTGFSIFPQTAPGPGGPPNPVSVYPFGNQPFQGNVTFQGQGTGRMSWTCTAGSVFPTSSASGEWVTYTAPATTGTYSITATSLDDSSKKASWGISVTNASTAMIYNYLAGSTFTAPGGTTTLTGWFSGKGSINHGVGSVTSGFSKSVAPSMVTGYQLSVTSGKTSDQRTAWVFPQLSSGTCVPGPAATFQVARQDWTWVVLPDGRILVAGGNTPYTDPTQSQTLASIEQFDPSTGAFRVIGQMNQPRIWCAMTPLTDGNILIVGGLPSIITTTPLASWEVFNPTLGTVVRSGSLSQARWSPATTLLLDGRVLVAGGEGANSYLLSAEIIDSVVGTTTAVTPAIPSGSPSSALLLPNGKVLLSTGDLFDPVTQTFTVLGSKSFNGALVQGPAQRMFDGTVLVAGPASFNRYDPVANTVVAWGDAPYQSQGVQLADGRLFFYPTRLDPTASTARPLVMIPSLSGAQALSTGPVWTSLGYLAGGYLDPNVGLSPSSGTLLLRSDKGSFVVDPGLQLKLDRVTFPLKVGNTHVFQAQGALSGSVAWSVKEGSVGGTITSAGVYTAPSTAGIYHVVATNTSNPAVTATAEVLVIQTSEVISSATITSFSASPVILSVGQSTSLTGVFSGGTGVIDNGVGPVTSNTPVVVTPTASTTYTLTVTDPQGVPTASKATVYLPPVISNFKAAASVVPPGGGTTLSWSVSGASSTVLKESTSTGDIYANVGGQSFVVYPSATTTYTLTATNPAGGSTSSPITVVVSPVVSITVNPVMASVVTGQQIQFGVSMTTVSGTDPSVTWSTSGGTITASGVYTAPTVPGSYAVTATSVADPLRSASSVIMVAYPPVTLTLSPSSATLKTLQQMRFGYSIQTSTGASQAVTWAISEGSSGGVISTDGTYTAPSVPGVFHVIATSLGNPGVFSTAVVTVSLPDVQVIVSPGSVSLTQGETYKFGYSSTNGPVTWSTTGGTITSDGQYAAPLVTGTYQVLATSALNPSYRGAATVTVTLADSAAVSVSPGGKSLFPGGSLKFSANVVGLSNTGVTWSIVEVGGGAIAQDGTYTAPTIPGVYTVVATSVQNTSISASAKITIGYVVVTPDEPVLAPGMTKQFSASLAPGVTGPVTWSVDEGALGGSILADSGLYTAPSSNGIFHVQATLPDGSSGSTTVQIGLIDDLVIGFPIQVNIGGTYRLSAKLAGSNGQSTGQQGEFFLFPGTAVPELKFLSGDILRFLGVDGPWSVQDVVLEFVDPNTGQADPSDKKDTLGSTGSWLLRQFQQPWIRLNGQFKASGLASSSSTQLLGIQTDIGVDLLAPGTYTVTAALADSNGVVVAYSGEKTVTLSVGSSMVSLVFPGDSIRSSGKNGPYKVVGFTITGWTQDGFDTVGIVAGFNWDQF